MSGPRDLDRPRPYLGGSRVGAIPKHLSCREKRGLGMLAGPVVAGGITDGDMPDPVFLRHHTSFQRIVALGYAYDGRTGFANQA